MTFRALVLGFLGVILFSGLAYFNDHVLKQTYLVGHHMPPIVYGGLILFLFTLHPILARLWGKKPLSTAELAVMIMLPLAVCGFEGTGFFRNFGPLIVLPHQKEKTLPGWKENDILKALPEKLLVDPQADSGKGISGFMNGLSIGQDHISLSDIPWKALADPFSFWLPLAAIFYISLIGLALVLHRQWSEHEHLPYPIAAMTHALLPQGGNLFSKLIKNRGFLIAAVVVLLIHLNNYLNTVFEISVPINLNIELGSMLDSLPSLFVNSSRLSWTLNFTIFFSAIAVAFLIPKDVSFSIGLSPIFASCVVGFAGVWGYSTDQDSSKEFFVSGAYLAIFLSILYTGRFYYLNVFKRAVLPSKKETGDADKSAIWGARLFIVGSVVFTGMIASIGLDWQLAIGVTFMLVVFNVGMSRILAETGLFYIQPLTNLAIFFVGIMGTHAIGPVPVVIIGFIASVLFTEPREIYMPYIVNGFKILGASEVKIGKTVPACIAAVILGMGIATIASTYFIYDGGMNNVNSWSSGPAVERPFTNAIRIKQRLEAQGMLKQTEALSGWSRFAHFNPETTAVVALALGFGLTLAFSYGRLRFPGWPIHPLLFAVAASWPAVKFGMCFLIGWFIKVLVSKYGGENGYQKVKPIMIGLIAGEILGAVIPILVGLIYYWITGEVTSRSYLVYPG